MTNSPVLPLGNAKAIGVPIDAMTWLRTAFACARAIAVTADEPDAAPGAFSAILVNHFGASWVGCGNLVQSKRGVGEKRKGIAGPSIRWIHERGARPDWATADLSNRLSSSTGVQIPHTPARVRGVHGPRAERLSQSLLLATTDQRRDPLDADFWAMTLPPQDSPETTLALAQLFSELVRHSADLLGDLSSLRQHVMPTPDTSPMSPSIPEGFDMLTHAQQALLPLLAAGHSEREIAIRTFRSVHTVRSHVKAIYARLGVRSRVSLALLLSGSRTGTADQRRQR